MIGIIIALALIVWASYNLGKHVTIGRVLKLIEDLNNFNHSDLTGKSGNYRQGYLDAIFTLLKKVGRL